MRPRIGSPPLRRSILAVLATAMTVAVAGSTDPAGAAPVELAAAHVDARVTLDTAGGAPLAGREFLIAVAIESLPVPNGPPFRFAVAVTLPEGVEFRSASPGLPTTFQCESSGRTVTCRGRSIGGEITSSVNLRLRAARAGSYTIRAAVVVEGDTDSDSANNAAEITVDVSAAPPATTSCIVPKVLGKTLAAARQAILKAGCRPGAVRNEWSAKVLKGRVLRQSPPAGRRVARGTRVLLVLSRGPR
jgi:hypothetical protein